MRDTKKRGGFSTVNEKKKKTYHRSYRTISFSLKRDGISRWCFYGYLSNGSAIFLCCFLQTQIIGMEPGCRCERAAIHICMTTGCVVSVAVVCHGVGHSAHLGFYWFSELSVWQVHFTLVRSCFITSEGQLMIQCESGFGFGSGIFVDTAIFFISSLRRARSYIKLVE